MARVVFCFAKNTVFHDWLDVLSQIEHNGVTLYEIFATEDEITRERLLLNKDGIILWSTVPPDGYNPAEAAHIWWPWLATLAVEDPQRLWYEAVFDTARVETRYLLLPEESFETYIGALKAKRNTSMAKGTKGAMVDPDAFLITSIGATNNSYITLGLQLPPTFTNRVDLFGISSLASFPWQLLATMPPATSRVMEVALPWSGSSGFFRAGDADTDSDGDGLSDVRERLLYGTDPAFADSDGDALPDGWEVTCGLNPLLDDALSDFDNDGLPAIYEYYHGTDPTNADSHTVGKLRVDPIAATTNTACFSSIKEAFAASSPYSIIELADGVYAGKSNTGLWFPSHPVILMSERWGTSRRATLLYDGELAAFYMNASQNNHTIVRGINLQLGGITGYQIGFWLGGGNIIAPGTGVAPVFEGVSVLLGNSDVNVGFFCRHSSFDTVRFINCIIRGRRGVTKPLRGIYAIDSPSISLVNCTFQDFPPEPYAYGIQLESTPGNYGGAPSWVNVNMVNCLWDESFAQTETEAFVRLEKSIKYYVSLTNCLVPRELDWFPPETCTNLLITNANLALGGHLRDNSPAIGSATPTGAPLYDFEGQLRNTPPDMGADEYMIFPFGQDSDSDCISDNDEINIYGTNPYDPDSDGDSVNDGDELSEGTDPTDPYSANRCISVTVINRLSTIFTNVVSYAFDDTPSLGTHVITQFAGNASFTFPFSFITGTSLWIKAACDMDGNGVIDPALEPIYSRPFHYLSPNTTIEISDFDGDGVNDWLENQYGSSPTNPASCHVTVSGALTNLFSGTHTNYITYGFSPTGWDPTPATNIVKQGSFEFPSVPANSSPVIYIKAFCDLNGNGFRDTTTEPLYVATVADFAKPMASILINDFDGDGVPDHEEAAEGTDPSNARNYCFSVSGVFTNNLRLDTNIRLVFERVMGAAASPICDFAPTNGPFTLPHTVTIVSANWRLRCYNDDNGNQTYETNEFSRVYVLTRHSHDVRCDVTVNDHTFDSDRDGMSDLWERLYDAVTIGVNDALDDPDGDGLINLHEYWSGTNPGVHDVHPSSNALLNATLAIDDRIAGKNPATALPIFLNYIANGNNGIFIRNPDCWAADIDLTCCSPWNSNARNRKAGTLISPRQVLFVVHSHYTPPVGTTMYFVGKTNEIITRTLVATVRHPDCPPPPDGRYPDIAIGLLDSDVPTNIISFAKVLPDDYAMILGTGQRLPCLRLDQEEKALIGDVGTIASSGRNTTATMPIWPDRMQFYEDVITGDSGNPMFIILDGQPVLLTLWTMGVEGSGTSTTMFKEDINALMRQLDDAYQLTPIDLSQFINAQ